MYVVVNEEGKWAGRRGRQANLQLDAMGNRWKISTDVLKLYLSRPWLYFSFLLLYLFFLCPVVVGKTVKGADCRIFLPKVRRAWCWCGGAKECLLIVDVASATSISITYTYTDTHLHSNTIIFIETFKDTTQKCIFHNIFHSM